ncbi:MAG: lipoprotein insertase outer membrane protein LolB [Chromatiales bacterium]|nr:lipoprotein insertase outer membrane protein LolB [Chromatiales bacterium]
MKQLLTLLPVLLLIGCTTSPPHPHSGISPEQSWQLRQQQLQGLNRWQIAGRLAVIKGHEAWHMSLEWQQLAETYAIHITAPLGQGAMRLEGDTQSVTLQTDEGESITAQNPDWLLYQQLGWQVPVSALRYWVLGLPAPGEHTETLDDYGRLSHLQQAGWEIEFIDYQPELGVELPRKVFVSNHQAKVKLVISDWSTLPATIEVDS